MRIGIFGGEVASGAQGVERFLAAVGTAQEQGFASFWLPQIFGYDALTLLAVAGAQVPDIELGTAVIPTYPRHPVMLAAQALTVQTVTGGRLALGIGLSHQIVIESMFGYSFDKPVGHMRDYLAILAPLLDGQQVAHRGDHLSAHAGLSIQAERPSVLVAALGTQMLRLTARHAEGTITWMTGPNTIAEHTAPTINSAAKEAGRGAPRIVCGLPVCVTAHPDTARAAASEVFSMYGFLPSYRAMLDREGAAGPADVAIVGDAATVQAGIERCAEAGVTDFAAVEFSTDAREQQATRDLLRSLL